jgi:hypothetical protein
MHLCSHVEYNSPNIFRSDRYFGQNLQVKETIMTCYAHCIFQSNLKQFYPEVIGAIREQMRHGFHNDTPLLRGRLLTLLHKFHHNRNNPARIMPKLKIYHFCSMTQQKTINKLTLCFAGITQCTNKNMVDSGNK